MKSLAAVFLLALLTGLPAYGQGNDLAVAPPRSTAPDPRKIDQSTAVPPSITAAPPIQDASQGYGNWRSSAGLNADPNNPSGAPGPSAIGTNPSR